VTGSRALAHAAWIVTAGLCAAALVAGALPWLLGRLACVSAPVFLVVLTFFLVAFAQANEREGRDPPWRSALASALLVLTTCALLLLDVPVRVAFLACRDELAKAAGDAAAAGPDSLFGRQIGPYRVGEAAVDERGGLYLRVFAEDGILEIRSYGFSHQPNEWGSPFGVAGYAPVELGDGWAWFAVSDD